MIEQVLDARYRIVQVLNADLVEENYLAEDTSNSNFLQYLIKKLRHPSDNFHSHSKTRQLFASEAKSLENLACKHDQIQKLFSYFEENKEFYLVQELVTGNSLSKEIFEGTLKEYQVINILSEVLEILVFVHNQGVIHQQIRPGNIIRRESSGKLVLVDFGAIKKVALNIIETSEYTPIEQLHGNPQSNSDIYALGIIAIVALTGSSVLQSHKNFLTGEILWRKRAPKVSENLAKIINKMVRLDYRKRYQSATEVLRDLNNLTKNQPRNLQLQRQANLKLVLIAGIASFMVVGLLSWFLLPSKDSNYEQVLYQQGVINYEQGNFQGAINNFNKAIQTNPKYALAYNRRGNAYYRLENFQKSQEDASEAIRLNPQDPSAYYDRGFTLYKLGNYNGAIADYNQAIKLNPQYANAYYGRGLARIQIKERQGAMADFTKAIALKGDYGDAYLERGILRRKMGIKLEALKDLEEAVAISPDPRAYYERALGHYTLNEKKSALKDYNKAIELDGKYLKAYLGRGDVYSDLGYRDKAIADYNQALAMNPKSADVYTYRGIFLLKVGDTQAAIEDYNQAIVLDPKQATAYNYRGNAYLELGNLKEAVNDYSKAIEINPDYALAYYNRGLIRTDLGKVPDAIDDFQKASALFQEKGEQSSFNDAQARLKSLTPKSSDS
ncbi:MAG: tetratricopeptide repeat protein [Cyanomargarita calcarea GSE-NOS-MK-12-04C]|jgi:tetratricopeptide (TPR) repeat protein|uniref:Tetratricopeptide repeat protein n=1 Tax=Cyanomargarita calcarea GSE-NOS-MK-12-04C TaxID=2839659 RepID=A0A951QH15_9CYAN|nr:tetratricopeptide repeat protein [Cyanomargarita calcarea GSE-NOS-MK-12-04C]